MVTIKAWKVQWFCEENDNLCGESEVTIDRLGEPTKLQEKFVSTDNVDFGTKGND